jgi:hypothetical protein
VSQSSAPGRSGQEVRLALVLSRGVSLAVRMGGVTHEIDLLRRASRVAAGESEGSVGGVSEQTGRCSMRGPPSVEGLRVGEVVVDIAGTSAGGLNGTLAGHGGGPRRAAGPAER